MSYVYVRSESSLWTVGFYGPDGKFQPESDHGSPDEAAQRAAWLNGGGARPMPTGLRISREALRTKIAGDPE